VKIHSEFNGNLLLNKESGPTKRLLKTLALENLKIKNSRRIKVQN